MSKILIFVLGRVENIVGKGENAGYQHFLLFLQCFQKLLFQGRQKSGLFGKGLMVSRISPSPKIRSLPADNQTLGKSVHGFNFD